MAVDIGGTKLLTAEVTETGEILNVLRESTDGLGKEARAQLAIDSLARYGEVYGFSEGCFPAHVGIGINDIVDHRNGIWTGWDVTLPPIDLRAAVKERFGADCAIDNDVKCTVMAENLYGAGKGCRDMIYLNIGTGLACAAITGGKVIRGSDNWAGEIGFMRLGEEDDTDAELLASGTGIRYLTEKLAPQYPESPLIGRIENGVTGQDVFAAEAQGDALAKRIADTIARVNGRIITNMTCVLSPEIVVLGGGLASRGGLFERIVSAVTPKTKSHIEKGIVLTALDPDYAGLMGAAVLGLGYRKAFEQEV